MTGDYLRLPLWKSNIVAALRNEWKDTVVNATEIWVVTDGRAGNVAQALSLAEAIARRGRCRITNKTIPLKPWAAWVPPQLSHILGESQKGWPFIGIADEADSLTWPWPGLIVSAGRRVAPIVAALKKLHGVPAVHLLDPQMSAVAFDAVIVPDHDTLQGGNVLKSLGALTRHTKQTLMLAGRNWSCPKPKLPIPRLAVLIGGPSKSATFTEADGKKLVLALDGLANHFGLTITTSRRTPADLVAALQANLAERAFIWTGEHDGPNPYPGLLESAVAILVTEDSVNMASEAASTGKPVHVFPITSLAPKLARFHEALEEYGASKRFRGEIVHWQYAPLAEADRIASDLHRRGLI